MSRFTRSIRAAIALLILIPTAVPAQETDQELAKAREAFDALVADLREKGEPTTLQDLAPPPIPDDQNAAIHLKHAAERIVDQTDDFRIYQEHRGPMIPTPPDLADALLRIAEENRQALSAIKAASATRKLNWNIEYKSPAISILLPHLAPQRQLALVTQAAAISSHVQGDEPAALGRVRQMIFLGNSLENEPFLVCHLVALGIHGLATDLSGNIAANELTLKDPAAREAIKLLIHDLLDESAPAQGLSRAFKGERLYVIDTVQCFVDGKLSPEDFTSGLTPDRARREVPRTVKLDALLDAPEMIKRIDQQAAASAQPTWPAAKAMLEKLQPPIEASNGRHLLASMMQPNLSRAIENHFQSLARRRIAAVALAARWYAADHNGELPGSLDVLVPEYLPAVPADPMAEEGTLRYRADEGTIYSVGVNGKDDRGDGDADILVDLKP